MGVGEVRYRALAGDGEFRRRALVEREVFAVYLQLLLTTIRHRMTLRIPS